jgi:hypothetical protein
VTSVTVQAERDAAASPTLIASEVCARQRGYKGDWPPNPLALPGDADYLGVCKLVDGVWVVKPDPPAPVASLSDIDLQLRLKSYQGAEWVNSSEHKEVLKRRAAQPAGAWA